MEYYKVTIFLNEKDIDVVTSFFFENNCLGNEIIESNPLANLKDKYGEIYTLKSEDYPSNGVILIGYFEKEAILLNFFERLSLFLTQNNINIINNDLTCELMPDIDYTNYWKEQYQEIVINENISIVPSWFTINSNNKLYLKIEPGLGFGTGSHETTQMCLKHLVKHLNKDDYVIDLGTGSGILAILAYKLNASKVYALDIDKDALKNATLNAKINDINDIVFTNTTLANLNIKANLIVANIVFDVIIKLLPSIKKCLIKNGKLILSGILQSQKANIVSEISNYFEVIEIETKNEWVSIVCINKG